MEADIGWRVPEGSKVVGPTLTTISITHQAPLMGGVGDLLGGEEKKQGDGGLPMAALEFKFLLRLRFSPGFLSEPLKVGVFGGQLKDLDRWMLCLPSVYVDHTLCRWLVEGF
ncbi:hypothetical protein ACLOJK_002077 [Asimina triloba]